MVSQKTYVLGGLVMEEDRLVSEDLPEDSVELSYKAGAGRAGLRQKERA